MHSAAGHGYHGIACSNSLPQSVRRAVQAAALAMALCAELPGRMLPVKAAVARALAAVAVAAPDAFTATPPCRADPALIVKLPQAAQATPMSDAAIVKLLVATSVKRGSDTAAQEVAEAAGDALQKVLEAFKGRDHLGAMWPIQDCAAAHAGTTTSGTTCHVAPWHQCASCTWQVVQ